MGHFSADVTFFQSASLNPWTTLVNSPHDSSNFLASCSARAPMDPRRPWIRRNGDHSALGREIQDRALDDTGVVDVGERGNRQRRVEIRKVIGRRYAARAFAGVAETAATKG